MHHRSLLGLSALLLGASCVPPQLGGASPKLAMAPIPNPAAAQAGAGFTLPLPPVPDIAPDGITPVAAPAVPTPAPAPPFVDLAHDDGDARRALDCLTAAIYYEARSESTDGQRAVAQVVLNRVRNPAFPSSVCGVVYQGSNRLTGCQFTFTCDGSISYRREPAAWEKARAVAQAALAGDVYAPVGPALYYHSSAVSPWWASAFTRVATIGAHIFYRWGGFGGGLSFRQAYSGIEPMAGAASASGLSALARYSIAQESSVTVHRGPPAETTPAQEATSAVGVRLHYGTSDADAGPPDDSAASVRIHTGSPPASDATS